MDIVGHDCYFVYEGWKNDEPIRMEEKKYDEILSKHVVTSINIHGTFQIQL